MNFRWKLHTLVLILVCVAGAVVGTKAYLSPDQLTLPQKELDLRSDLFSLGVTLYECASGEHPFMK